MAIRIKEIDNKEQIIGDILPEYIPASLNKELKIERDINSTTDGYTPDRTMRKIGVIPREFLYNYAMMKGVPPSRHGEFWSQDNGKNIKSVLNEFDNFKVVDKPL